MRNALHRLATLPRAVQGLLVAGIVFAGLTVAAVAREPESSTPPPAEAASQPAGQVSRAVSQAAGRSATAPQAGESPTPTADELALEGAIPVPAESELPSAERRLEAGARFALPLKAWTTQTDRYGAPRGGGLIHGGIDLAVADHTAVYSACTGAVASASYSAVYGNNILVDCGDGWSSLYAHLSQMRVRQGDVVTIEMVLGLTGSTGYSTGEHLHFEIRYYGTPVNPEHYLDFHIPVGAPLSSGPIVFARGGSRGGAAGTSEAASPSVTPTQGPPPTVTNTPTRTATPTNTPTNTPTPTWTPTPRPPAATPTRTPRPLIK